ncbi:MAG: alpha-D-ribose 1-methylphosphonate 5-triphosphate diphosphatase [Cyanobacteria bacterium J06626_14]
MNHLVIQGADVLSPVGWIPDATVVIEEGRVSRINPISSPPGLPTIRTQGLQMLPGIVDIHGDAFERMICPRPGVSLPLSLAIAENDRSLLAAGITTFFYSITDSFEPGLRSRAMARQLIQYLQADGVPIQVDSRIHIRHEQANTADFSELCDWIDQKKIQLVSLNDHLPESLDEQALSRYANGIRKRVQLSDDDLKALVTWAAKQRDAGAEQVETLVERSHTAGVPVASHDDDSEEKVAISARRQVAIAEFPSRVDLAAKSQEYGASVLMGSPNLVRGGSHVGFMSVKEAIQGRVLDCLCSDYHYPSLFYAPFLIEQMKLMPFEEAWKLVSEYPARAAQIQQQKGAIAPGLDADFLLVKPSPVGDPAHGLPAAIAAVFIKGKEVARYDG